MSLHERHLSLSVFASTLVSTLASTLALGAMTACSGGGGGGGSPTPVAPLVGPSSFVPGSVVSCPSISGDYICAATDGERGEGRGDIQVRVRQSTNPAGQPILSIRNQGGDRTYIADGSVQTQAFNTSSLQYVVSCSPDSVILRAAGGTVFDTTSIFRQIDRSRIRIHVRGVVNGGTINDHRTCVRSRK